MMGRGAIVVDRTAGEVCPTAVVVTEVAMLLGTLLSR